MERFRLSRTGIYLIPLFFLMVVGVGNAFADETCQSPYMPKIVGQEDYVYIITVGVAGMGDGSDKLVTIGDNPKKETYGKINPYFLQRNKL